MAYERTNYHDVEPRAPGMHFLRDALGCEHLGVTVLEAGEGWTGKEHDHAADGHEEVYLLLSGSGTITVDGEDVALSPGDVVRVPGDASRRLHFEEESRMVIAGAP